MAEIAASVTIEEYLATSYHPDVEFIDGLLKEKPMVGLPHGEVQAILAAWFRSHRVEWGIRVAVDTRTQVQESRVRLPDIVVVSKDERSAGTLLSPPLIAIEILSPADKYTDLKNRASDLQAMGTENVWLIDPELRTAEVWTGKAWASIETNVLQAVNSPVFVDLGWLWAELDN